MKKRNTLLKTITKNKRNTFLFFVVLSIICSLPLILTSKVSFGHDLNLHLARINAIKDGFVSGNISNYIYTEYINGYGYGAPLFYPDVFLYIPASITYLGINIFTSYKIFLWLISFCSIITMYLTVKRISGNKEAAIISSFIYCFAPYRLTDLYIRSALGECLALVFLPLVIYGIYEIIYGEYKKFHILVLGMTGVILSHVLSILIITFLLIILCLVNIKRFIEEKKRILYLFIAASVTLLLTAFFLWPMVEQLFNISLHNFNQLYNNSISFIYLFLDFPTIKPFLPVCFGIGFTLMLFIYFSNIKHYKKEHFMNFCLITSTIILICTTNLFPWEAFPYILKYIEPPFRLNLIPTALLSIGIGLLFMRMPKSKHNMFKLSLLLFLLPFYFITVHSFTISSIVYVPKVEEHSIQNQIYYGEYLPSNMLNNLNLIENRGTVITSTFPLETELQKKRLNLDISFSDNKAPHNKLEMPLTFYKGYQATINGKAIPVYETEHGLVGVEIKDYQAGQIRVEYQGTFIQRIAKYISIFSWIAFCLTLLFSKKILPKIR